MNNIEENILCVSAGLSSKKNPLLETLKNNHNAKIIPGKLFKENSLDKLLRKIPILRQFSKYYLNIKYLNKKIKEIAKEYDYLFIVKGNFVRKETLKKILKNRKHPIIIGWSPDDIFLTHNNSEILKDAAPFYDFFFTAKKVNIEKQQLKKMGFKNPFFIQQGYSANIHYPNPKKDSFFKEKIIFIGYGEKFRFQYLNFLAKKGLEIHVWGNGWGKFIRKDKNLKIHNKPLIGILYSEAISNAFISLCFLRKINNDQHTSRTFEIPACKGFMIAERSSEHLSFYEEDKEAVYFSNKNELLSKIIFFKQNKSIRDKIAEAGYKRTINSGYSYDIIAKDILKKIKKSK